MPDSDRTIRVFIENEAASSIKNTFDEKTLQFLGSAEVAQPYPFPYGFMLDTRSGDGDCVDCFVVTERTLRTGDIVECAPVHLLEQIEDGEIDHKVLCVDAGAPKLIGDDAVATILAFVMSVFSHIPGKRIELGALLGPAEAEAYIERCRV